MNSRTVNGITGIQQGWGSSHPAGAQAGALEQPSSATAGEARSSSYLAHAFQKIVRKENRKGGFFFAILIY